MEIRRKDRRAQEADMCAAVKRRPSLDLSGRSRKWSTGAKKLPPRIVDLLPHVSTCTYVYVCVCARLQPVRSEKPSTGRYVDDDVDDVALLPPLCPLRI